MVDLLGNMKRAKPSDLVSPPMPTFGMTTTNKSTKINIQTLTQRETLTIWTSMSSTTLKKMKGQMRHKYLYTSAIARMYFLKNNRGAGAETSVVDLLSPKDSSLVQSVSIPDRACLLSLDLKRKPNQSHLEISKSQRETLEVCGMKKKLSHMMMIWSLTWI